MSRDIAEVVSLIRVIPVLTIQDAVHAVPLAQALMRGGLNILEVTFRTDAAREAIRRIAAEVLDAIVGAGTVTAAHHFVEAHASRSAPAPRRACWMRQRTARSPGYQPPPRPARPCCLRNMATLI